jgi:micrococcal nuclease
MIVLAAKRLPFFSVRAGWSGGASLLAFFMLGAALLWPLSGLIRPGVRPAQTATLDPDRGRIPAADYPAPRQGWRELRRARLAGPYQAQVLHVIDGDTFAARITVWLGQDIVTLVRLRGVDAPEMHGRCRQERARAHEAKRVLAEFLASGTLYLRDIGQGKYAGRTIAEVHVVAADGKFAGEAGAMLLAGGYARPYRGGHRNSWCATPG